MIKINLVFEKGDRKFTITIEQDAEHVNPDILHWLQEMSIRYIDRKED